MADGDMNVMQAQLGLLGQSSMSPLGIPTPMPNMPQVKHPGEVSQEAVRQTQSQSVQTMQSAMMTRPGAMGGWQTPGQVGPFGGPIGSFAQQFQANMSQMNGMMFNPFMAQAMAGMMGQQGFAPGMLPSPVQMTSPSMGIFRSFPQGPMPSIPPVPQMPLFQTPFTPRPVSPQFQTPYDYNHAFYGQRASQWEGAALATPGVMARGGVDFAGTFAGAGIGAALGARFGGGMGARFGGGLGALAGFALSEGGGFGQAAQHMMDGLNPFAPMARRAAQMRGITQEFVVGGSEFGSPMAARRLGRQIEDVGYDSDFRRQTGGQFSVQDLTRITRMSGEQGLLDMTQTSGQIAGQVKNVAKLVRELMRIVGEPDVKEVIKQMGQMNAMGLSMPEMERLARNAKTYARMAGTTVKGIMESGLAGASTYQQMGLSAGLGYEMGMGTLGMARQAVSAGVYNPQQLSMLGGVSGIAQRDMMSGAAMLRLPMMAAGMSRMGANGTFGLDPSSVLGLINGNVDIHQMTTMGANNLLGAVNKGGVGALGMYKLQERELQDQLGRVLGPRGMKVMTARQVMQTQKLMGLDQNAGGLATAAMSMGLDEDQTRQFLQEAGSPAYWRNMQTQSERERMETRASERERRDRDRPGMLHRWANQSLAGAGGLGNSAAAGLMYGGVRDFGIGIRDTINGVGSYFDRQGVEAANWQARQATVFTERNLLASSPAEERQMRALSGKEMSGAAREMEALARRRSGEGSLFGVRSGSVGLFNDAVMGGDSMDLAQARAGQGGLSGLIGGGVAEGIVRLSPFGALLSSGSEVRAENERMSRSANTTGRGLSMSGGERTSSMKKVSKAFGGEDKAMEFRMRLEQKMAKIGRDKTGVVGDTGAMQGEEFGAFEETAREMGLNTAQLGDARGAMTQMAARGASIESKTTGGGELRFFDAQSMQKEGQWAAAAQDYMTGVKSDLFGNNDGLSGWLSDITGGSVRTGEERRRDEVMDMLANVSPEVATVASLIAAGNKVEAGKLLMTLPEDRRGIVEDDANSLVAQADAAGNKDLLAKMGRKVNTMQNPKAQRAWVEGNVKRHIAGKAITQYRSGVKKLVKDSSLLADSIAPDSVLRKLSGLNADRLESAGVSAAGKKIIAKYKGARTDKERTAAINDWENLGTSLGDVQEANARGGDITSSEGKYDTEQGSMAATQTDLAKNFPGSVDIFADASQQMLEAAKMLKQIAPDTYYNPGTNTMRRP